MPRTKTDPLTNPTFKKYRTFPDDFDAERYRMGLERWLDCLVSGYNPVAWFYYGERQKNGVLTGCYISGT